MLDGMADALDVVVRVAGSGEEKEMLQWRKQRKAMVSRFRELVRKLSPVLQQQDMEWSGIEQFQAWMERSLDGDVLYCDARDGVENGSRSYTW